MSTLKYTSPVDMHRLTLMKDTASLSYARFVLENVWAQRIDDSGVGLRVVFTADGALSIDPLTDAVTGGTIKTISFYEGDATKQYEYTGLSLGVNAINDWLNSYDDQNFMGNMLADNDMLIGSRKGDVLWAHDGKDTLNGGTGADTMEGGFGSDTYFVDNIKDVVIDISPTLDKSSLMWDLYYDLAHYNGLPALNNGWPIEPNRGFLVDPTTNVPLDNESGIDTVISTVSYDLHNALYVENLTLSGTGTLNATGNDYGNVLRGNASNNVLKGYGGRDVLYGGKGADTIDIKTGDGNDPTYDVDRVVIGAGQSTVVLTNRDVVQGFNPGEDLLDMPNNFVADNVVKNGIDDTFADGVVLKSHQIINGLIEFGNADVFFNKVIINSANLQSVLNYLGKNVVAHEAVAFGFDSDTNGSLDSTYVFSDSGSGTADNLVLLLGTAPPSGGLTEQYSANSIFIV